MESVETTYRLSDLYAVNFRAWRSYIRALLILEAFFVGLILIPLLLDGWSLGEALRTADWWLPLLVGAIVLFLWFVFCPLIGFWRTKRMDALGPNRYSFESNIIRVETPRIESLVKWSAVKRIVVSRDRLFLFIRPGVAFIIPRRAFNSDEGFQAWIDRANEKWTVAKTQ